MQHAGFGLDLPCLIFWFPMSLLQNIAFERIASKILLEEMTAY